MRSVSFKNFHRVGAMSFVKPDCVIAKVDGPGLVDLLRIFAKKYHSHLYIFLYILAYVGHILF